MNRLKFSFSALSAIAVMCSLGSGTAFAESQSSSYATAANTNWAKKFDGDDFYRLGTAGILMKYVTHTYEQTDCPANMNIVSNPQVIEKSIYDYTPTFVGNNPAEDRTGNVIAYNPNLSIPVDSIVQIVTTQTKTDPMTQKQYWVVSIKSKSVSFNTANVLEDGFSSRYAIFPPSIGTDINWTNSDVVICQQADSSSSSTSSSSSSSSYVSSSSSWSFSSESSSTASSSSSYMSSSESSSMASSSSSYMTSSSSMYFSSSSF